MDKWRRCPCIKLYAVKYFQEGARGGSVMLFWGGHVDTQAHCRIHDFCLVDLRSMPCGLGWRCMHDPFVVLFLVIPLSNPWDLRFFFWFREDVFLVEILQFLLICCVLGAQIMAMGCPWGTPTILKSHANQWSESGDRDENLGELTRGSLFVPSAQILTSALHRSNWCDLRLGFGLNVPGCWIVSRLATVSGFVLFGAWCREFFDLGFSS
jgi:hypothetical protein